MDYIKDSQVFTILKEIANLNFVKPCCNERYLPRSRRFVIGGLVCRARNKEQM